MRTREEIQTRATKAHKGHWKRKRLQLYKEKPKRDTGTVAEQRPIVKAEIRKCVMQ